MISQCPTQPMHRPCTSIHLPILFDQTWRVKSVVHGTDQLVVSKSWGYPKNARWMVLVRENPINQNGWSPGVARHDSGNPKVKNWLVVSTPVKNIRQLGLLFPRYGKIKNVPKHQPVKNNSLHQGTTLIFEASCFSPSPSPQDAPRTPSPARVVSALLFEWQHGLHAPVTFCFSRVWPHGLMPFWRTYISGPV